MPTVVDRLLASPRFGEHAARHWLDVVRYAESTGKDRNIPYRYAWRYRDYVIDAFNADKPYDRFLDGATCRRLAAGPQAPQKNDHAHRDRLAGSRSQGSQRQATKSSSRMDVIDDQIDVDRPRDAGHDDCLRPLPRP